MLSDEERKEIVSNFPAFDMVALTVEAELLAIEIEKAIAKKASQQVQGEPDFKHPKIQALIGKNARQSIQLGIYEKILDEDFDGELSQIDCEYMETGHEKLLKLLEAMPTPKQEPVENMLTDIKDMQQNAWLSVCKALDEVKPAWLEQGKRGIDCAVDAIKSLAAQAQAASITEPPKV